MDVSQIRLFNLNSGNSDYDEIIVGPPPVTSAPEIAVTGNGVNITSGDVTPSAADSTDFGSVKEVGSTVTRTFTIANTGVDPLTLSGTPKVAISGSSDFTVTQDPVSPVAATNGTTTFQITFDPSSLSVKTATVTISNDDADEGSYTFGIQGKGVLVNTSELWRPRLTDTNRSWYGMASSADGTYLAGVVNGGNIYISADAGTTWTARDASRSWRSIAMSVDGRKMAAVADAGQIYTSTDFGSTWTARESVRDWTSITSSADGTRLAATESGGFIYTSSDSGVTWAEQAGSGIRTWYSIASSADGRKLVAADYTRYLYTSTDYGVTWAARATNARWWSVASSADGNRLVAVVSNGKIYTSVDAGLNWTARESNRGWNCVASSADGIYLAAAAVSGQIYTSTDAGATWTASETARPWRAITSSADGTKLAAAAHANYLYTSSETVFPAEMSVTGLGIEIVSGDTTSAVSNDTDFGAINIAGVERTHTFTINNTGPEILKLTGTAPNWVKVTGNEFKVTTQPNHTLPALSGTTTFVITFDPSSVGVKTATVTIPNEDINEDPYTFTITGIGMTLPTVATVDASGIKNNSATLNATVNPNGTGASVCFEYSTASNFAGAMTTPVQNLGLGFSPIPLNTGVLALRADTQYYFRVVATNALGLRSGSTKNFQSAYPISTGQFYTAADGVVGDGMLNSAVAGMINNSGRVLIQGFGQIGSGAVNNDNDKWLMTDASGTMKVIAREGSSLGGGQSIEGLFGSYLLSESGRSIAVDKIFGAPSNSDYAYFTCPTDASVLDIVSREGDVAPDGGVFLSGVSKPCVDNQDRFYFYSSLGGLPSSSDTGIWYDDGVSLKKLIQAGTDVSTAVGTPAWLGTVTNIMAAGGDGCAFVASLQSNPADLAERTDLTKRQALFSAKPGSISMITRRGDTIIGVTGATVDSLLAVSRNSLEQHAYRCSLAGDSVTDADDYALVSVINGTKRLIAREGTTLVAGLPIKSFGSFFTTTKNQVVFLATLDGATAVDDGVLCRWTSSTGVRLLAREGSSATGTGENYGAFHTLSVSDNGNIALLTNLMDGTMAVMRLKGTETQLTQLVRSGGGLTVAVEGVNRLVNALSIFGEGVSRGGGGGMGYAINDDGKVSVLLICSGSKVSRVFH